jgi:hypothetical protein
MATLLPFPARRERFWPSLGRHLCTTTAIGRNELAELSPFGAPEIGWRRSPVGMELVWPGVLEEGDRILVTVSGHWQPLRDPQRAIIGMLEEAEFEYEALRPIEPWALVVQPQDAALSLPAGEEDRPRRSRRYSATEIDQLRMALRLAAGLLCLARQHSAGHLLPLHWLGHAPLLRRGTPIRPPISWLGSGAAMHSGAGSLLQWAISPWLWRSPGPCRLACKAAPDRSRTEFLIASRKLSETTRCGSPADPTKTDFTTVARGSNSLRQR